MEDAPDAAAAARGGGAGGSAGGGEGGEPWGVGGGRWAVGGGRWAVWAPGCPTAGRKRGTRGPCARPGSTGRRATSRPRAALSGHPSAGPASVGRSVGPCGRRRRRWCAAARRTRAALGATAAAAAPSRRPARERGGRAALGQIREVTQTDILLTCMGGRELDS